MKPNFMMNSPPRSLIAEKAVRIDQLSQGSTGLYQIKDLLARQCYHRHLIGGLAAYPDNSPQYIQGLGCNSPRYSVGRACLKLDTRAIVSNIAFHP